MDVARYMTWTENGFTKEQVTGLVSQFRTVKDLLTATPSQIESVCVPAVANVIKDFLKQDYHVE